MFRNYSMNLILLRGSSYKKLSQLVFGSTDSSSLTSQSRTKISYIQGQSPVPKIREYFYYIDHQGMLFLDDTKIKNFTSCFKEKKFLAFFFSRLQINDTGKYLDDFPYFSPCGRENNYVCCDDLPIVFTHVIPDPVQPSQFLFCYAHAGDELSVKFEPDKVIMLPRTGRVYHPAPEKAGSIGLVRSALAIEFSKFFSFVNSEDNPPTHFTWNGTKHELVKWYDKDLPDSL